MKNHAKLLDLLNKKLTNFDFISRHRTKSEHFTRNRSFTFKSLALFIISNLQSSIQRELDRFFKSYNNQLLPEQFVTQSAFSQARSKISPTAFLELIDDVSDFFYSRYEVKKWNGFRLLGIDGSSVVLPKTVEIIKEFGEYSTSPKNRAVVLARMSKMYDVLNNQSIDIKLVNRKIGEQALAIQHLDYCKEKDLVLLDRGYPSYELFREILASGVHFCARVTVANWGIAKKLVESGQKEAVVELMPSEKFLKKHKKEGLNAQPIKCRFICVELSTGEKEVLITSLLDDQEFPHDIFKELYHLRWGIEESFKKDKHRLQLENFSGKSITAIYQDLYANILMGNLTAIFSSSMEPAIKNKRSSAKHKHQVNMTTALSKVKDTIALLFTSANITELLDRLVKMILKNTLPIRPGRRFERNKFKRKQYYKTYLPL